MSDFISKSRLKWEIEKWYEKEYYSSFNSAVYNALLKIIDKFPSAEPEKCGDKGEISDGYHTFNQLYHQRAILFATIVNQNKDKSWKSYKHSDGKYCFDNNGEWFIVGIDTPEGSYTYHYSKEYWDYFECKELDCGKEWDGHTEDDVIRLLSLASVEPERKPGHWEWDQRTGEYVCSECGCNPIYERTTPDCSEIDKYKFCRWCGAKMMDEQTLKYADTDTAFGGLQSAT